MINDENVTVMTSSTSRFPSEPASSGSSSVLQIITLHQATRWQWAVVGEEGGLHIQASLCQRSVAAGGRTDLLRPGDVWLLPLSCGPENIYGNGSTEEENV